MRRFFHNEPSRFDAVTGIDGSRQVRVDEFAVWTDGFKQAFELGMNEKFAQFLDGIVDLRR